MRTLLLVSLVAIGVPVASSAKAQDPEGRATVTVAGRGTAERAPDSFLILAALKGRGTDQVSALRALTDTQSGVTEGLNALDGLTGRRLRTDAVFVQPILEPGCQSSEERRETPGCSVIGYSAEMRIIFKGTPANRAGDAVSLASELGAESASSSTREIEDPSDLRAEAARLAFEDARSQAQALAVASGRRLGRIVQIQDPTAARQLGSAYVPVGEAVVTGSRIRPTVAVPVEFPPVRVDATVNVVFELE